MNFLAKNMQPGGKIAATLRSEPTNINPGASDSSGKKTGGKSGNQTRSTHKYPKPLRMEFQWLLQPVESGFFLKSKGNHWEKLRSKFGMKTEISTALCGRNCAKGICSILCTQGRNTADLGAIVVFGNVTSN